MRNVIPAQNYRLFRGLSDLQWVMRLIRRDGLGGACKGIFRVLQCRCLLHLDVRFERNFELDTCGITHLNQLTIADGREGGTHYEAVPVALFQPLLSVLPRELSEFTFIDFGSGKGRGLLLASLYNFKRIIGIEFARELHEIAQKNIERFTNPNQRCLDIVSICMDARTFQIPSDKCVLFFFNPFRRSILAHVLESIVSSLNSNPRKIYVIYYNPDKRNGVEELFSATNIFVRTSLSHPKLLLLSPYRAAIYETHA